MPTLSLKERRHAIHEIIEARFSVRAFEEVRRMNPQYWASPRNDMARGIYGEAMRAKQALIGASDAQIASELLGLRLEQTAERYRPA